VDGNELGVTYNGLSIGGDECLDSATTETVICTYKTNLALVWNLRQMMHPQVSGATWVVYEGPRDSAAAVALVAELAQKHPYREMNRQSETQHILLHTYIFSSEI
jgi:hypothetical protein